MTTSVTKPAPSPYPWGESSPYPFTARLFAANMPIAASLARATGSLAIVDPFTARIEEKLGGVVSRPIRQALTYHIAVIGPAPGALTLAANKLAEVLIARLDESAR